ncbi:dTMP kinase [Candidatus Dojkabacteria bacterium]|uniref:Thymidylate kinase n=1 Tax=Candidatus Dojkabacteria bacterium TaxID=2099670 RepID=A0A952DVK4_9BACT|nr:dTMP kinase [Candidatus Dojkabacteria bacterium]
MKNKGLFIVIDGTDGSGKATQTKIIKDHLLTRKFDVELMDFPQYGSPGAAMVEEYLNGRLGKLEDIDAYQASILFAIDRFSAATKIRRYLSENKIVIANRYTSSNIGHQAGKIQNKTEREKFIKWLLDLEYDILKLPVPDKTILLYLDPAVGQKRVGKKGYRSYLKGKKSDIHEDSIDHLSKAAKAYKEVAVKQEWTIINADQTIEQVTQDIITVLNDILI